MPFGLKNIEVTYQHLVNGFFREHIKKTVEVYIYDMIKRMVDHAMDIITTFNILDRAGMKLNLKKCTFAVKARKFLSFLV